MSTKESHNHPLWPSVGLEPGSHAEPAPKHLRTHDDVEEAAPRVFAPLPNSAFPDTPYSVFDALIDARTIRRIGASTSTAEN
ncbi:hypothetical protein FFI94_030980 [Rhodococcus sp. KBS0724]|uniref:hypothetical protein n=1 Tax=Rhodococcus sp. KBS0724 TaxID=1179674 RepID=UPI00110E7065|nr:hypothetical protein [Rhodococcus sp. KBS0724]TSD40212.1 hypothetical protein FFI94_030980 [Rhodococcus sp. KBS0724]